jgi:uncharacterized protein (TIGR02001 family)
MKTLKITAIAAALLTASSMSHLASAEASISANVGFVSEYHFRGIQQIGSGSASAGLDYENGGFYLGTWAADVDDGLEIDVYAGYGLELDNGLSLGAGVTTYQYTGEFDSAYNELNLSAGFGIVSLEYTIGTQDGDGDLGITEADYTFTGITLEHNGFSGTFGTWGDEFEGEYVELTYGTEIGGFDVGVGVIFSGSDLDDDEAMYFSISKAFDL